MELYDIDNKMKKAGEFLSNGQYEAAIEIYLDMAKREPSAAPYAYYFLGLISNITGDPVTAKGLFYQALALEPDICKMLLGENHPNRDYVFSGKKDEVLHKNCCLCGSEGVERWCYFTLHMPSAHLQDYNPVRLWMYCEICHHMWAEEFPIQKDLMLKKASESEEVEPGVPTNPGSFGYYSKILSTLGRFSEGNELLEIGVGGSECALVAQEMGYNVFAVDISAGNVLQAQKYGIKSELWDFMDYEGEQQWDIIIMGDVIEHVSDPVAAMEKVSKLLTKDGVLWLSTPNFEAAFAVYTGHNDPMRKEASHKNYFSRQSMFALLERFGFIPVDYQVSGRYNGSMEIIAIRGERIAD
jgi:2-polyprenyl-3-methyl-5-hydroxy-6-metoxy-1,4-benzoquinol methylase